MVGDANPVVGAFGGMMEGQKVATLLYAEFGDKEFLTRQISEETMAQLVKLMGITETGHVRNTKVGKAIGSLDGNTYTVGAGQEVRVKVERPDNPRLPRRFRLASPSPVEDGPPGNVNDKAVGIETPDTGLTYQVVLVQSGYGYAVFCPALRGCVSQGLSEAEALENIREAITGWLKFEARDVERRVREMLEEYRAAGYPVELAAVSVGPIIG